MVCSATPIRFLERFRLKIAAGKAGWGQKGTLALALVRSLAGR